MLTKRAEIQCIAILPVTFQINKIPTAGILRYYSVLSCLDVEMVTNPRKIFRLYLTILSLTTHPP
jgi:hypothetical protein